MAECHNLTFSPSLTATTWFSWCCTAVRQHRQCTADWCSRPTFSLSTFIVLSYSYINYVPGQAQTWLIYITRHPIRCLVSCGSSQLPGIYSRILWKTWSFGGGDDYKMQRYARKPNDSHRFVYICQMAPLRFRGVVISQDTWLHVSWVNLPNRYSRRAEGLWLMRTAETWASYRAVYRFGNLSVSWVVLHRSCTE